MTLPGLCSWAVDAVAGGYDLAASDLGLFAGYGGLDSASSAPASVHGLPHGRDRSVLPRDRAAPLAARDAAQRREGGATWNRWNFRRGSHLRRLPLPTRQRRREATSTGRRAMALAGVRAHRLGAPPGDRRRRERAWIAHGRTARRAGRPCRARVRCGVDVFPSMGPGAPHLRDRFWLVATDARRVDLRLQPGWLGRSIERQASAVSRDARAPAALPTPMAASSGGMFKRGTRSCKRSRRRHYQRQRVMATGTGTARRHPAGMV